MSKSPFSLLITIKFSITYIEGIFDFFTSDESENGPLKVLDILDYTVQETSMGKGQEGLGVWHKKLIM